MESAYNRYPSLRVSYRKGVAVQTQVPFVSKYRDNNESSYQKSNNYYLLKNRLVVSIKSGFKLIHMDEIIACVADSNYTEIHLKSGEKVVVSKTLKSISSQFNASFYRIHSSTIINLAHLSEVNKTDGIVVMGSGKQYLISRRMKSSFIDYLKELLY